MRFPRAALAAAVMAALLSTACGARRAPAPTSPEAAPPPPACVVAADSTGPPRAMTVVFADSGDAARARLADSLETPVRLDCEGRALPGLARAWSRDSSGRFWTLSLHGSSGSGPSSDWTAAALASAWQAAPAATALRLSGVVSLLPLDERRLVVGFSAPQAALPPVFAELTLGVPRGRARDAAVLAAVSAGDLRDALDAGADVVVGADPALLDYARRRSGAVAVPLPWSRSYVLLVPAGSALPDALPPDTAAFRAGLARDAVRAEARGAAPPFWWDRIESCPRIRTPEAARSDAIAYDRGDASARELAERLVALAGPAGLTTRGLPRDSLSAALRSGSDRAYVVSVPAHALVPCREVADWPAAAAAVGLVETRAHAVIWRGTPALGVDWDGTLRPANTAAGSR
jgi:hypothetical protein